MFNRLVCSIWACVRPGFAHFVSCFVHKEGKEPYDCALMSPFSSSAGQSYKKIFVGYHIEITFMCSLVIC